MIEYRYQEPEDAERFFEILSSPNFTYFTSQPKTVQEEKERLEKNTLRREKNTEWNFTILYGNEVIWGIGVKINYHRNYIGEIGYFLDETYWGKGIITKAVQRIEEFCRDTLHLSRVEIIMQPENYASEKIAIKNGYEKEGILKNIVKGKDGTMKNCLLYAKLF